MRRVWVNLWVRLSVILPSLSFLALALDWDYSKNGEDWTQGTCGNTGTFQQSPIDLPDLSQVDRVGKVIFPKYAPPEDGDGPLLFNNGKYISVTFKNPVGGFGVGTEYPPEERYALVMAVVRAPSEHLWEGRRRPLEIQFFHRRLDKGHEHEIAAVAVGYEEGNSPDPLLAALLSETGGMPGPSESFHVNADALIGLDFGSLLFVDKAEATEPAPVPVDQVTAAKLEAEKKEKEKKEKNGEGETSGFENLGVADGGAVLLQEGSSSFLRSRSSTQKRKAGGDGFTGVSTEKSGDGDSEGEQGARKTDDFEIPASVFRYKGTLTEPPCAYVVTWFVKAKPAECRKEELWAVSQAYSKLDPKGIGSYRLLQPRLRGTVDSLVSLKPAEVGPDSDAKVQLEFRKGTESTGPADTTRLSDLKGILRDVKVKLAELKGKIAVREKRLPEIKSSIENLNILIKLQQGARLLTQQRQAQIQKFEIERQELEETLEEWRATRDSLQKERRGLLAEITWEQGMLKGLAIPEFQMEVHPPLYPLGGIAVDPFAPPSTSSASASTTTQADQQTQAALLSVEADSDNDGDSTGFAAGGSSGQSPAVSPSTLSDWPLRPNLLQPDQTSAELPTVKEKTATEEEKKGGMSGSKFVDADSTAETDAEVEKDEEETAKAGETGIKTLKELEEEDDAQSASAFGPSSQPPGFVPGPGWDGGGTLAPPEGKMSSGYVGGGVSGTSTPEGAGGGGGEGPSEVPPSVPPGSSSDFFDSSKDPFAPIHLSLTASADREETLQKFGGFDGLSQAAAEAIESCTGIPKELVSLSKLEGGVGMEVGVKGGTGDGFWEDAEAGLQNSPLLGDISVSLKTKDGKSRKASSFALRGQKTMRMRGERALRGGSGESRRKADPLPMGGLRRARGSVDWKALERAGRGNQKSLMGAELLYHIPSGDDEGGSGGDGWSVADLQVEGLEMEGIEKFVSLKVFKTALAKEVLSASPKKPPASIAIGDAGPLVFVDISLRLPKGVGGYEAAKKKREEVKRKLFLELNSATSPLTKGSALADLLDGADVEANLDSASSTKGQTTTGVGPTGAPPSGVPSSGVGAGGGVFGSGGTGLPPVIPETPNPFDALKPTLPPPTLPPSSTPSPPTGAPSSGAAGAPGGTSSSNTPTGTPPAGGGGTPAPGGSSGRAPSPSPHSGAGAGGTPAPGAGSSSGGPGAPSGTPLPGSAQSPSGTGSNPTGVPPGSPGASTTEGFGAGGVPEGISGGNGTRPAGCPPCPSCEKEKAATGLPSGSLPSASPPAASPVSVSTTPSPSSSSRSAEGEDKKDEGDHLPDFVLPTLSPLPLKNRINLEPPSSKPQKKDEVEGGPSKMPSTDGTIDGKGTPSPFDSEGKTEGGDILPPLPSFQLTPFPPISQSIDSLSPPTKKELTFTTPSAPPLPVIEHGPSPSPYPVFHPPYNRKSSEPVSADFPTSLPPSPFPDTSQEESPTLPEGPPTVEGEGEGGTPAPFRGSDGPSSSSSDVDASNSMPSPSTDSPMPSPSPSGTETDVSGVSDQGDTTVSETKKEEELGEGGDEEAKKTEGGESKKEKTDDTEGEEKKKEKEEEKAAGDSKSSGKPRPIPVIPVVPVYPQPDGQIAQALPVNTGSAVIAKVSSQGSVLRAKRGKGGRSGGEILGVLGPPLKNHPFALQPGDRGLFFPSSIRGRSGPSAGAGAWSLDPPGTLEGTFYPAKKKGRKVGKG